MSGHSTSRGTISAVRRRRRFDSGPHRYIAFHGVHTPLEAPAHYVNLYDGRIADRDRKVMGGMVSAVDTAVGAVVDALRSRGMYNNSGACVTPDRAAARLPST